MTGRPLRVMVVDDSVVHRQTISDLLRGAEGVEVAGKAANGEEALRMVGLIAPDLITLDLEMPRMDGFTFLRILMARQPTPVVVISSQSQRENVFKALELGALDFVARPGPNPAEQAQLRSELLAKVEVVRALRPAVRPPPSASTSGPLAPVRPPGQRTTTRGIIPRRVLLVASSTGGPQAVVDLVGRLPASFPHSMIVAQHMPERFTRTFAERLDRRAGVRVAEAEDGALAEAGTVWICPGGRSTELEVDTTGPPRLRVTAPDPADRHVPSADRLFRSACGLGPRVLAVVITGMGEDGALGVQALKKAGAEVWVEAAETAVVDGMPAAVRRLGLADQVLPLPSIIQRIASLER